MSRLANIVAVAKGEAPADIILHDARVVNVFTGEILSANVAVKEGFIAGVGDYSEGVEIVGLAGKYLLPGLIDAHIHIESSLLTPAGFAEAAVPHGTTAVVADPHEIANVAGLAGVQYMVEASRGLPLDIFYMMPSCVPATHLETAGAVFGVEEIHQGWQMHPESPGLAEMMNFPGVIFKDPAVLAKIEAAREKGLPIDGHAPLLGGRDLDAYVSAGISTDHECTTAEEALEKLRAGMKIIIREGSAAQNLAALLPAANEKTWPNLLFGCDDRHPADLIGEGHMDHILRKAVALGLDPVMAVRMATLNTARHYRLAGLGAVAPGYRADLVVVNNLIDFRVEAVYKAGRLVARDGNLVGKVNQAGGKNMRQTVHLPDLKNKLALPEPPSSRAVAAMARVIEVYPEQILTGTLLVLSEEMYTSEIAKVAVVERHGKNGNVAVALVKGFGPINGALASTVAHDSHNLIIVGSNDEDMELAARTVAAEGGGLAVAAGGKVLACVPLPVAGLMSDQGAEHVAAKLQELHGAARRIGCVLPAPFMTMSFMALPVIPELKITDRGLVDVGRFELVDLWVS